MEELDGKAGVVRDSQVYVVQLGSLDTKGGSMFHCFGNIFSKVTISTHAMQESLQKRNKKRP